MKQKVVAWVVTILVIALLPLPFAVLLTGASVFTEGLAGAPKEFFVSYFFGLFTLLVSLFWYLWKVRKE